MKKIIILILIFILVILYLFKEQIREGFQTPPANIADVWYINLDRSSDRRTYIENETSKLLIPVKRWSAVDGSKLTDEDFNKHNIPAWSRPSFALESKQKTRFGEIGCFLSHKSLLQHLNTLDTPSDMAHLILEDDAKIDDNFIEKWNISINTVDPSWDIIFVGLLGNNVNDVKSGIGKPEYITGTHAYVVKQSSLDKIIAHIDIIYDPIDEVYAKGINKLNIYALSPSKINQGGAPTSTIANTIERYTDYMPPKAFIML